MHMQDHLELYESVMKASNFTRKTSGSFGNRFKELWSIRIDDY